MKWTAMIAALILTGCGTATDVTKTTDQPAPADALRKYESEFRPSDHDPVAAAATAKDTARAATDSTESTDAGGEPVEYVPGFRVQIFASTSIDAAKQKKGEAETLFPKEWFYIQYDPPTYKIRAGNFQQRYEAERFVRQANDQGFKDSWAVPERVVKNPPPPQRKESTPSGQ
jgi:hypothetical protein